MISFKRIFQTFWLIAISITIYSPALTAQQQPLPQGSWTIAVIPDTQYYVRSDKDCHIFTEITQWLVDNKEALDLQLVLHVGDIVDKDNTTQWERAKTSLSVLDGKLPYVITVGNHDLHDNSTNRNTMLNDYFKITDNPLNQKIFGGCFEEGRLENTWYKFQYRSKEYIIFALEFGPRDEVLDWADLTAAQHKNEKFILVTHDFIDQESTLFTEDGLALHTNRKTKNSPYGYGISKVGSVNCGDTIWSKLVSKYPNFEMTFNGHYKAYKKTGDNVGEVEAIWDALATGYRKDTYENGNVVHQMLFNAQWAAKGGEGWIRLLHFSPDGDTVTVKTYSPYLARTAQDKELAARTGSDMQFELKLTK